MTSSGLQPPPSVPSAKLAFVLKMDELLNSEVVARVPAISIQAAGKMEERKAHPLSLEELCPKSHTTYLQPLTLIGHQVTPSSKEAQKCISGSSVASLKKMKAGGYLIGHW